MAKPHTLTYLGRRVLLGSNEAESTKTNQMIFNILQMFDIRPDLRRLDKFLSNFFSTGMLRQVA